MPFFSSCVRLVSALLLFSLLFSGAAGFMRGAMPETNAINTEASPTPTLVLDAGHGGRDGGAVGVNGVLEKDLNLQITLLLGSMLEEAGFCVVYTRTDDRALYTAEQDIPGKRKMYDLKNRLALAEECENPVLISIHMNKFADQKYSGLQVYYSAGDGESRRLAQAIQTGVRGDLQPSNSRHIKRAGEEIYLLHRATFPAVLIECGFLSNAEECAKLSSEDYRKQLSFSIYCAIIEYVKEK